MCQNIKTKYFIHLAKTIDGESTINNLKMVVNGGDKIAFIGDNSHAKNTLL
ncbi:MAG: hypothetical protein K9L30_17925 [Desulfobacterales bacterium]|nr:hypothetical protein [Desulfobacterales bacterium]